MLYEIGRPVADGGCYQAADIPHTSLHETEVRDQAPLKIGDFRIILHHNFTEFSHSITSQISPSARAIILSVSSHSFSASS